MNKKPIAIAVLLFLSFAACGKEETKNSEPAKIAEQAESVQLHQRGADSKKIGGAYKDEGKTEAARRYDGQRACLSQGFVGSPYNTPGILAPCRLARGAAAESQGAALVG